MFSGQESNLAICYLTKSQRNEFSNTKQA